MTNRCVAGIILGPSVLGHIPNFSAKVFPQYTVSNGTVTSPPGVVIKSLDTFTVMANMGLIFFLFLMGLELESDMIKKAWKKSVPVAGPALLRLIRGSSPCSGVDCVSLWAGMRLLAVVDHHQRLWQRTDVEDAEPDVVYSVLRHVSQLHGIPRAERSAQGRQAGADAAWRAGAYEEAI